MAFEGIILKISSLIDLVKIDIDLLRDKNKKLEERMEILEAKIQALESDISKMSKVELRVRELECQAFWGDNYNP